MLSDLMCRLCVPAQAEACHLDWLVVYGSSVPK